MTGAQTYTRLLRYSLPHWRVFIGSIAAMLVLAITEPAIPALLKPLIDGSFVEKDVGMVHLMAVVLVGVFAVRGVAGFLGVVTLNWVASRVVMDLRNQLFDKLVTLPTRFYDHNAPGSLISKLTYDVAQVSDGATSVVTVLVRDSVAVLGLLAWLVYLDWQLTLVVLTTAPLVVLVVKYFSRRLRSMSHFKQSSMGDVTHAAEEVITGHRVVRSFRAEEHERRRFFAATNWARRYSMKFTVASAAGSPIAQLITATALAVIVWVAGERAAAGNFTVGTFVSFFSAMALLFPPLKRLTSVNGNLQKGIAAATSVFALIDEPSEHDTGKRVLGRAEGRLTFQEVHFRYASQDHAALAGFDLSVDAGETVALVGPSGSGKTTLASLVPRFYEPQSGCIRLDGVDIRELTLDTLRDNVALVSQDIVLFDDTVAGNIAYGPLSSSSEEQVLAAAHAAHATEFIDRLPQGMATRVGNRGVRLSGGQRQRLAIARAFLKDAPVLILDEATSSLDTGAERHIQTAIEELRKGRTTIIIAHRLSSVERADRIVVMSHGSIVDVGSHRELLEHSKLYAALYRFQFSRDEVDTPVAGVR